MDFEKEKYNLRNHFPEYTFDYLPTLITDDIWDYYLDLYEKPIQLKTQWNKWLECASEFESMDSLFKEKNEITNIVWNNLNFKDNTIPKNVPHAFPKIDRYTMEDGFYFSIDLCEAMMRLYNRHGITKDKSWSELIEKYTKKTFFKSKPARITIHHYIMKYWSDLGFTLGDELIDCAIDVLGILETQDEIILWLKEHGIKFSYVMGDNLLFKIPNEQLYELCLTKLQQEYIINNDYRVHLDIIEKKTFVLNNSFLFCLYKSSLSNKTLVISKNEDVALYYPQIYKQLYYNEPIAQEDLLYGMGLQTKKFNEKANIKPFKP